MIESTAFLALALLYTFINRDEPFEINAVFAIVFTAIYLAVYLLVSPQLEITPKHLGGIFGYVPIVSFAAILFPQLNSHSPIQVTRFFGWLGLVVVLLILCILKLFVW